MQTKAGICIYPSDDLLHKKPSGKAEFFMGILLIIFLLVRDNLLYLYHKMTLKKQ